MRPGQSFESEEAAEFYQYRPDYSDDLIRKLTEISHQHNNALDLGCGPGKIARRICHTFKSVTALDASASMIAVAQELQATRSNIKWVCALAEEADFGDASFDLIVAGASIHWMDHSIIFPRLLKHVSEDHVFAVVDGDDAYLPPWQKEWDEFLGKWIFELTGQRYEPLNTDSQFTKRMIKHRDWLNLIGNDSFEQVYTQSLEDFVRCQLSRDTFAPSKLQHRIEEFSEDLINILKPHTDSAGMLTYRVQTTIEWGFIQASA